MAVTTAAAGHRLSRRSFSPFSGVLVPALTPFAEDLAVDREALLGFCRWQLEEGADGLAIFGTTSEANSLSLAERLALLEFLTDRGIPASRLMPGTGACSLPEAVELTRAAIRTGAPGVLLLPPFYYKNVPEDGVFTYYAEVIERVGESRLKVFLYHIPQMSGVAITPTLVARLIAAYGSVIAGLKDSSGSWESTAGFLREFPDLAVFPASERFLLQGLAAGAAGCISATANFQTANIRRLIDAAGSGTEGPLNDRVSRIRAVFEKFPLIPGLKAAIAQHLNHAGWRRTRPPLAPLPESQAPELLKALAAAG
jgi:4-hydroxy-tetrahydrodipicolinate synthase